MGIYLSSPQKKGNDEMLPEKGIQFILVLSFILHHFLFITEFTGNLLLWTKSRFLEILKELYSGNLSQEKSTLEPRYI